jgi:hypothetical protein
MSYPPEQLESALVIALKKTIKWESSVQQEPPVINPALPVDPTAYQARDRALAFRDLIVGASVVEASVQVSNVYNFSGSYPGMQGPVFPSLDFYGSNTGQVNTQVRHVLNSSIPWDAARYADCDLYGRDLVVYEVLTRACAQAFVDNPLPDLDSTGTIIPSTSVWSLAEGTFAHADINAALPLDKSTLKTPDQTLAARDNQMAGYVAQLVQVLKNPFAFATRLYVQSTLNGQLEREPDIYALITDDGTNRVFQTEPALTNGNQITYNIPHQTLQWVRELVDEIDVPQIYALSVPGILPNEIMQTVPAVPDAKDAQYWRGKASVIIPNGQSVVTVSHLDNTYDGSLVGGLLQIPAISFTAPGVITGSLAFGNGTNRLNVLIDPCPVVEILGGENISNTSGTNGGADWAVNVASGDIGTEVYYVQGGSGIVYNGSPILPGNTFPGNTSVPNYTQIGPFTSSVRQAVVSWNLALPPGSWALQIEYADLTGQNTGFGILANYTPPGQAPSSIAKDIVPLFASGPAGNLTLSQPNYFEVTSSQTFNLSIWWTYGTGQLHVQRLIFTTTAPVSAEFTLNGTLGNATSTATFLATENQTEVVRMDFPPNITTVIPQPNIVVSTPPTQSISFGPWTVPAVDGSSTANTSLSYVGNIGDVQMLSGFQAGGNPTVQVVSFTGSNITLETLNLGGLTSGGTTPQSQVTFTLVSLGPGIPQNPIIIPPGTLFSLSTAEVPIPVRIMAIDVQAIGTYATTPVSADFQGWRQECIDRAERAVQQGYNETVAAYNNAGLPIPTFRDSGSAWVPGATEDWMSFVEILNPRLREVPNVTDLFEGRQYQAVTVTVYAGATYSPGEKFYGIAGTTSATGTVSQVGAFRLSQPGHLGRPCLVPYGIYFDSGTASGTGVIRAYWDTPYSVPTVVACQPWMIAGGFYAAQPDFWMPDILGPPLPLES